MIPLLRGYNPPAGPRDDLAKNVTFLPFQLFKGTGAKSAEEVRDVAKDMALKGHTQKEIYDETAKYANENETGMFQNPAGQWVFEIPDNTARFTPEALQWLKSDRFTGGGDTGEMNLDRLLSHDTLYNYDPGMRKVKASITQPGAGEAKRAEGGYGNPTTEGGKGTPAGRIEVFGKPGTEPDDPTQHMSASNLLLHEIQHPLQWKWGMPQGGNADDAYMQSFFETHMKPQANKTRVALETAREKYAADFAASGNGGPRLDALEAGRAKWALDNADDAALLDQAVKVGGAPGRFASGGSPALPRKPQLDYFEQYRSLAGEQAARRAAERAGMTTMERRAKPPFMAEPGIEKLSPAFQMIRNGTGNFSLPDARWALANTMFQR